MNVRLLWLLLVLSAATAFAQAGYVPMPFDVQHYDLSINVDPADSSIVGICTINVESISDTLRNARFDLVGLTVDSVRVDGHAAQVVQDSASLYVHLYDVMPNWTTFSVVVSYHGTPGFPAGETWGGFRWGDPTYTIGVAFSDTSISMTRRWMPCHDAPDDKATITYAITVPSPLVVGANGALTGVDSLNGEITYHWDEQDAIATYLMTFVVGHYHVLKFMADSLPVEIYASASDIDSCRSFFSFLDSTLKTFQTRFGPYPFNKIGYALVPLSGGMESQTLITFGSGLVNKTKNQIIAAHELAHQWWGDFVTPFEFKESWLSEGLSSFSEAIFQEGLTNYPLYLSNIHSQMNKYLYSIATQKYEGIFPLYNFPRIAPSSDFPYTIYYKGAAVYAMLRWMYGDSLFFASLAVYRQQHQYQSATTGDLQHAFEITVHDTLGWFFNEWVYDAGWPVVQTELHQSDSIRLTLKQIQFRSTSPLFRMPYDIAFVLNTNDTLHQRILMEAVDSQVITLPSPGIGIKSMLFDPDWHVLGKHLDTVLSDVDEPDQARSIWITQNFPNPVGPEAHTTVQVFSNAGSARTAPRLILYNVLGGEVRDYSSQLHGYQEYVVLDLSGLPTGIYRYVLASSSGSVQKWLSVVR